MTTQRRLGEPPSADLMDPAELLSLDELRAMQLSRLQNTLDRVHRHVPFYREAFDRQGIRPQDCQRLADLGDFPTTEKQDLRGNYPFKMFAMPREQLARIHASSGTTGRPTVVGYTSGDLGVWGKLVSRAIRAAGGRPGQLLHNAYGYGLFTGGLGLHAAEQHGFTVVPVSGGMTPRQVQMIRDFEPDIITCTPTYLLTIIDEFMREGIDPQDSSLQVAVCGAEPWTDGMRQELENRLDLDACDIYGLSEVMGPGVASECVETKDGPHIWEDHFYPEILDPVTGRPVPDGEEGELVLTTLTNEAMPLIRYRTHDLARLLPGSARPQFRRMTRITGRSDDMVIIRGVNVFPTQVEDALFTVPELSPHFQLVLSRPGRMDELAIQVEARPDTSPETWDGLATAAMTAIKDRIGVTTRVDIVTPGTLERSMGKLRRIVDRRDRTD